VRHLVHSSLELRFTTLPRFEEVVLFE